MIHLLIADDHTLLRDGIKQMIADINDIQVDDEACDGHEVLAKVLAENHYNVVLLDIELPGINGLQLIPQIKANNPKLAVLILTMYPEEQYAIRALKAGASGYFTKDGTPDKLIDAIRKVAMGGKYISRSLAEKMAFYIDDNKEALPHELLSQREFQVMLLLASGKTLKEAAEELCIGITTVSTYRRRILEKMKLSRNADLTRYAINQGLLNEIV